MKKQFLSTLGVLACLIPLQAQAEGQEIGSIYWYDVPRSSYTDSSGQYTADYYTWKKYLEYNLHREQCQGYQDPPEGYVRKGCRVYRAEQQIAFMPVVVAEIQPAAGTPAPAPAPAAVAPAPATVTVYFDFDKSFIRAGEQGKIDTIINDIKSSNIQHVIIAGHTDTAGPNSYNMGLSQRRAQAITDALTARGIGADMIEQKSYGETDLAVQTPDNTPKQANRRTVVIFVQ